MVPPSLKKQLLRELEDGLGLRGQGDLHRAAALSEGLIDWAKPLLQPYRYKCLYGGRGGGKSYGIADCLLIIGLSRKIRVLCAREFQVSIRDSVHALLKERISVLGLEDFYDVQQAVITGANGSVFLFKGIRHNVQSIKSMAGLTHCWVEEAQTISAESWQILVPTIREEGSEIWVSFNPLNETDIVYQDLIVKGRKNAYIRRVNWSDNPYFPDVLNEERLEMFATDPDAYHHIWEGGFWQASDAQVLKGKWIVAEFEPALNWDGPYLGADFGFSQDPTVLVKTWIFEKRLYIEYESYAVALELDYITERWLADIPDCDRYVIRADSARPESISYLRRHGLPRIEPVKKWSGSVEDGIAHLRSYEKVIIHPRCPRTAEEARLYSYKRDRLSGQIQPVIVDSWNHCLVAGTEITTDKGNIPIEKIQIGDQVLTRAGFKPVLWSGISDTNRTVFIVKTQSGKQFEATENHQVLTNRGFIRVDALRYNDRVLTLEYNQKKDASSTLTWLKTSAKKIGLWLKRSAMLAGKNTVSTIFPHLIRDSAQTPASPSGEEIKDLITPTLLAQFAKSLSNGTNTQELRLAVDYVDSVSRSQVASKVYDLTVQDQHEFFANGVLVHNCVDAIRYSLAPIITARGAAQKSGLKIY